MVSSPHVHPEVKPTRESAPPTEERQPGDHCSIAECEWTAEDHHTIGGSLQCDRAKQRKNDTRENRNN